MRTIIAPPFPRIRHTYLYENKGDTHDKTCSTCQNKVTGEGHTYDQPDNKCKCGAEKKAVTYREVYTLTQEATSGSNTDYTSTYKDIQDGSIAWSVNGNMQKSPWQFGGGKNSNLSGTDRVLASTTPFAQSVDRIVVTLGKITNSGTKVLTVNSVTIAVYDSNPTSGSPLAKYSQSFDWEDGKVLTIDKPSEQDWSNCYYKITFNITTTGTTGKNGKNSYCTLNGFELLVAE